MVMICYFKEARVDRLSEMLWPIFMRRSCLIVGFLVVFCSLWALQLKYDELKKSMDALIASSVDSLWTEYVTGLPVPFRSLTDLRPWIC